LRGAARVRGGDGAPQPGAAVKATPPVPAERRRGPGSYLRWPFLAGGSGGGSG
jgi:hypothetical protein